MQSSRWKSSTGILAGDSLVHAITSFAEIATKDTRFSATEIPIHHSQAIWNSRVRKRAPRKSKQNKRMEFGPSAATSGRAGDRAIVLSSWKIFLWWIQAPKCRSNLLILSATSISPPVELTSCTVWQFCHAALGHILSLSLFIFLSFSRSVPIALSPLFSSLY